MIIDAHLHCTGNETTADVLRSLDDAGIDVGVLLAPFLSDGYSLADAESLRRANAHLARLVRGHRDRLVGFAVVNPSHASAPDDLRRAIDDGLSGSKMVPSGWYPYDAAVQPTFAVAAELALPLLFHSGIFIDGRSGRFCRPSFFEALRDHPGVRVALAHLGWPWTDEAIAVGLIDRIHGVPAEQSVFRFDLSFGPPPPYRLEAIGRALEVLGPQLLQFGSDCFLPCPGAQIAERRGWLVDLLDELRVDAAARAQIWSGTAAAWLRQALPPAARPPAAGGPRTAAEGGAGTPGGAAAAGGDAGSRAAAAGSSSAGRDGDAGSATPALRLDTRHPRNAAQPPRFRLADAGAAHAPGAVRAGGWLGRGGNGWSPICC